MAQRPLASPPRTDQVATNRRLQSWKEIAAYLERDVTTARRWERREGLPVHRHLHGKLGTLYGYTHELDAWRESRCHIKVREVPPASPRHAMLGAAYLTLLIGVSCHVIELAPGAWGVGSEPVEITDAHRSYLRGRYYWNKRTEQGFLDALTNFGRALDADPTYALAYSGLADTYSLMGYYQFLPKTEAMKTARAAAVKAVQLEPTLAEAHASLAGADFETWDWVAADREYRRAIELKPDYATVRHWYANYLSLMGRHEEAITEAKRALELDPLSPIVRSGALGNAYLRAGRHDEAIAEFAEMLRIDPTFANARVGLGLTLARQGRYGDAIRQLQRVERLTPTWRGYLAQFHAKTGDTDRARAILFELQTQTPAVSPVSLAGIHAALHEVDPALALLENAAAARDIALFDALLLPGFDELRQHPAFRRLLPHAVDTQAGW